MTTSKRHVKIFTVAFVICCFYFRATKPSQAPQRNRLNSQSKNQYSRDTLGSRPSWGQTAYGAPQQGYNSQMHTTDYNSPPQVLELISKQCL